MPIDPAELLGRAPVERTLRYDDTRALLYNVSIGMGEGADERELPFVFERPALRIVPTFAAVLGGGGSTLLAGVPIDWPRVLHGEQRLTIHRPFPAAAELVASSAVTEIVDKGAAKGAVITVRSEARPASGEPLYVAENVMFARGDGGCGGPSAAAATPHVVPDRAPDLVHVAGTRRDQAQLYRLNGDRNPLHVDPAFARRAGFPAPILHGLCSYGIACRAVLASVCDLDPARIASFDVRFTAPVFPGETIHTDIWVDGDIVSFRSRVPARGITSIDNGRSRILPASAATRQEHA